jgi:hypothetical protein
MRKTSLKYNFVSIVVDLTKTSENIKIKYFEKQFSAIEKLLIALLRVRNIVGNLKLKI